MPRLRADLPPLITGVAPVNATTLTSALSTLGGEWLLVQGSQLGPSTLSPTSISAYYTGLSPADGVTVVTYPAAVTASPNQTSIQVLTVPGVGANLVFCVTIAGQTGCSPTGVAAYALPVVLGVSGLPAAGASGAGGDLFTLTASGLGPLTVAGATYSPVVSYGGANGLAMTASCLARTALTAQTTIQCRTAQGAGGPYAFAVCVGVTGQCGPPSSLAVANLSYAAPFITISGYRGPARE